MAEKVVLKVGDNVVIPYAAGKQGVIVKDKLTELKSFLIEEQDGTRNWYTEEALTGDNQEL